jgi:C4-dicarboxylate-specific signal transduction histidine kinase
LSLEAVYYSIANEKPTTNYQVPMHGSEIDETAPRKSKVPRGTKKAAQPSPYAFTIAARELTEVVRHRTAISQVLRVISNSPHDLQPIFDIIIQNATRLCRATFGNLRLAESEGFRIVAEVSYPSSVAKRWRQPIFNIRHGPLAKMVARKSPLHIPDLEKEKDYLKIPAVADLMKSGRIRTMLIVPMLNNKAVIGAITVSRTRAQPFSEKEIEMVADFAAQATIALETTRREREYREMQMQLAHANRVATVGQLSASIAHELRQPLSALVSNGSAALRWLGRSEPEIEEAQLTVERIIKDANRASEVLGRIHRLVKKEPVHTDTFSINDAIVEVITLVHGEAVKNGIAVRRQLTDHLPIIQGDRVQLQQVILNLIINAIQAMSGRADSIRELHIGTERAEDEGVRIAVRDTGPGLSADGFRRLFEPFFTTKPNGMGIGLSICRSIVEEHGGRLWAVEAHPNGALFQFTIPALSG